MGSEMCIRDSPKTIGSFTLQYLYNDKGNCEKFLQALWNAGSGQSSSNGSVLFYQYGNRYIRQDCTSPRDFFSQITWQLVLPYGIVSALITDPRSQKLRPGKATKYKIDIPVWDNVVLQDLLNSKPKRQKGNTGATSGCIGVMPFSYAQREAAIDSIGTNLQELALSMPALATTAVGKEDWWMDQMKLLCAA